MINSESLARAVVLAAVLGLTLAACKGESFEAQVAAAEEAGYFNTVIALWSARAEADDLQAILQVGALYEAGPPAIQDFSLAAASYRQGMELGDTTAMIRLGALYERGQGVERDSQEALALVYQGFRAR